MGSWFNSGATLPDIKSEHISFGGVSAALATGGLGTIYYTTTAVFNGNTFVSGGALNTARCEGAGVGTSIAGLVVAGNNPAALSSCETYNGNTWAAAAGYHAATYRNAGAGTQAAAAVTGGSATGTEHYAYNGTTWASVSVLPSGFCRHGMAGTQGSLLIFGGEASDLDSGGINTTKSWNGSVWSAGGAMITARRNLGGAGTSTNAMSFGGNTGAGVGTPYSNTESNNGTVWSAQGALNLARGYLHGSSAANTAIGGIDAAAFTLVSLETYQLYVLTSAGGFITGGTSGLVKSKLNSMSGGAVIGGNSPYRVPIYRASMSGGFVAGGSFNVHLGTYRTTMTGGFVIGGTSPYVVSSTYNQDITWGVFDNNNNPITGGAAATSIKVRRVADNAFIDWSDLTFKQAGWTSQTTALLELSAVNSPGYYHRILQTVVWPDGYYQVFVRYTGNPVQNGDIEFYLRQGLVQEVRVAANMDMPVSTLQKYVKNKKELRAVGGVLHLYIYDNDGLTVIVDKTLKDPFGNDITIAAGSLAMENASSV